MRTTPRIDLKSSASVYMMLKIAHKKYHICTQMAHFFSKSASKIEQFS